MIKITTIKIHRFDDIETKAEVIDFSGKLDLGENNSKIKFKPSLTEYKQISRIKYSTMNPDATGDTDGAKDLICKNENIDEYTDLFEIDAYFPSVIEATYGDFILNLSDEIAKETFCFMISDGKISQSISMNTGGITGEEAIVIAQKAQIYGINDEYKFIEKIVEYPKFYEVQKWLSLSDVIGLKFFKQYYIRELNGSFFINKISGFNPELSTKPTKIELVYVSDKVPLPIDEWLENVFTDGIGNVFTDGIGNSFIY